jgi:SnoaL-like protein
MRDISIEASCERLVLDFAFFSDQKENEALAELFTQDGTMTRPSGETLAGRAAILKEYQSRPAARITRHLCTNIRIVVESENRAHGLTYALVYSALAIEPPLQHFGVKVEPRQLIGEFEDEFVRTDDGWKIASRRARFVMHTI